MMLRQHRAQYRRLLQILGRFGAVAGTQLRHDQLVNREPLGERHPHRAAALARRQHRELPLCEQVAEMRQARRVRRELGDRHDREAVVARRYE